MLLFVGNWYSHFSVFILLWYIICVLLNNLHFFPSIILLEVISIFFIFFWYRLFPQYLNALIPFSICQNLVNSLNSDSWTCFKFFFPLEFLIPLNTKAHVLPHRFLKLSSIKGLMLSNFFICSWFFFPPSDFNFLDWILYNTMGWKKYKLMMTIIIWWGCLCDSIR